MIELFHPDRMASRILGMGDMLSLIERAEQSFDEKKTAELEAKLKKNRFTLSDYMEQMNQLRKMGDLSQLAGMMPGQMGKQMAGAQIDDKLLNRQEAIVLSMTPKERETPSLLDASRKKRVAAGCGLEVSDVNRLLKQYELQGQDAPRPGEDAQPGEGGRHGQDARLWPEETAEVSPGIQSKMRQHL